MSTTAPSGATGPGGLDLSFVDDARSQRARRGRLDRRRAFGVSAAVTVVWAVYVLAAGHVDRVADSWVASVTMVFGSFVAGSTPQGGGAVAFPVFTKVLEAPSEVARSFSLCIQTVGMGCATASLLLRRVPVDLRALAVAVPSSLVGLVAGLLLLGRPDELFWPSRVPGPYVKVTFTVLLVAMAVVVALGVRVSLRRVVTRAPATSRVVVAFVLAGLLGGVASSLVGSGADVLLYTAVVVLVGVDPRVGVPTSVMCMAATSALGLLVLGVLDGQLAVDLAADGQVAAIGGEVLAEARPARQADLFGLWLAAVPVVAWGAPLGATVASRMSAKGLALFAGTLALAELVSTLVFLEDLRTDAALAVYGVVALVVGVGGLLLLARYRAPLLGLPPLDPSRRLTRLDTDVAAGYADDLRDRESR